MTVARPALAEVLHALSECPRETVESWLRVAGRERRHVSIEPDGHNGAGLCVRGYFADGSRGWLFPLTIASPVEALEILHVRDLWPWPTDGEGAAMWWRDEPVREGQFVALAGDSTTVRAAQMGDRVVGQVLSVSGDTARVVYQGNVATGAYSAMTLRRNPTDWSHAPPSIADLVAVASLGCERLRLIVDLAHELEHKAAVVWKVVPRERDTDNDTAARVMDFLGAGGVIAQSTARQLLNLPAPRGTLSDLVSGAMIEDDRDKWRREYMPLGVTGFDAVYDITRLGVRVVDITPSRVVIGVESIGT